MKHLKGNPATAWPDGASNVDLAGELIDLEVSKFTHKQQAPRIVTYTVNSNLFVEVRHAN